MAVTEADWVRLVGIAISVFGVGFAASDGFSLLWSSFLRYVQAAGPLGSRWWAPWVCGRNHRVHRRTPSRGGCATSSHGLEALVQRCLLLRTLSSAAVLTGG